MRDVCAGAALTTGRLGASLARVVNQPDPDATLRGPAPGQRVFGRYTLETVLGRGGMGVVWRAADELLQETVALKFLPDAVRWDPAAFEDLKAETRRARQLTHPNIIRIHDFVEDATGAAISMEWVDGATLTQLRMAKPARVFAPEEIMAWLPQLCAALDYAHTQAKVVHRDLKPSNVMLTRDGVVKVGDFGIARSLADSITRVSMMSAGTLIYMSPQQAMGEEPAATDDIYSLGAMLYELLAGRPPFHTGDVRAQLFQRKPERIAVRRTAALAEWREQGGDGTVPNEELPGWWEATIAACLAKEPEGRPPSAREVAERLGRNQTRRSFGLPWPRASHAQRRWLAGLAAGVGLALMGGWWWRNEGMPTAGSETDAAPTWPSDAKRAWAAWNFDGKLEEATGRGVALWGGSEVPTTDRFGRIDRALRFGGMATLGIEDLPLRPLVGGVPVSVSIWLKPNVRMSKPQSVLLMCGRNVGELWLNFVVEAGGRPSVIFGGLHLERLMRIAAPAPLRENAWANWVVVCREDEAEFWLDGRLQGRQVLPRERRPRPTERVSLRIGTADVYSRDGLVGDLDEFRIWRRALDGEEIRAMAEAGAPPRWVLTTSQLSERDDLPRKAVEEFGAEATLGDWSDLARWHRDDIHAWCDEQSFAPLNDNVLLQRNGKRWGEAPRHYMMTRFVGTKPDYYEAHDELGGMQVALGSWHSVTARALVRLPPSVARSESLLVGATGEVVRVLTENEAAVALGLQWSQELRRTSSPAAVSLRLRRGGELIARLGVPAADSVALALGEAGKPQLSRLMAATLGDYRIALTARTGALRFVAESATTGAVLFQEEVKIPGLKIGDVAEVRLSGPDRAEWVVE